MSTLPCFPFYQRKHKRAQTLCFLLDSHRLCSRSERDEARYYIRTFYKQHVRYATLRQQQQSVLHLARMDLLYEKINGG